MLKNLAELYFELKPVILRSGKPSDLAKIMLRLKGVITPKETFNILVFINLSPKDTQDYDIGHPHFGGLISFYGTGSLPLEIDGKPSPNAEPHNIEVDLSRVTNIARADGKIELTLVGVDFHKNPMPLESIMLEGLEIVTE